METKKNSESKKDFFTFIKKNKKAKNDFYGGLLGIILTLIIAVWFKNLTISIGSVSDGSEEDLVIFMILLVCVFWFYFIFNALVDYEKWKNGKPNSLNDKY